MVNFPASLEKHFLVSSVLGTSGVHTAELKPFQLGLFDSKFYKSVGSTVPSSVLFAVGSPHVGQQKVKGKLGNFANVNSVNRSYKTPVIDTRTAKVVEASYVKAQTVNQQPIAYLGYDGVNYCGSMQFECDKAYYVQVELQGQPVRAMWGRDLCELLIVKTDCCDACATGCTTVDMKEKYVDELVRQINEENLFLNRFIKASKVIKRCPVATPATKTDFTKYCITVCDDGTAMALARVQAQYTKKVTRVSRTEALSTYEMDYQLTSDPVPTAYSASTTTVQNCSVCPVGATATAASKIYKVTIDNTGAGTNAAAWLLEVQAIVAYGTATAAERIEFKYGTSTYLVNFPVAFVTPVSPAADSTIEYVGMQDAYCTMPATSYTWTACGTCYKITRKLRTTIQNPDCNPGQVLTDLVAFYSTDTSIVPGSVIIPATPVSDNCKTVYEIEQYSECMQDGCDWTAEATFKPVQAWNGFLWNVDVCEGYTLNGNGCPIPPAVTTEEFVAGIRFDVIYEEELPEGCAYSIYDNLNKEAIYVSAAFGEFNNANRVCAPAYVPFKQTQNYKRENLRGHSVIKSLIMTGYYEGEVYYDQATTENSFKLINAEGLNYGIDKNKFYDYVSVTFDSTEHTTIHHAAPRRWTVYYYFAHDDVNTGKAVIGMVNKLLQKTDLPLLA